MNKDYSEVIFSFDEIDNMIDDIVGGMRKVNSKEIGLDERCGYVYINDEYICVKKNNKKAIEYYGGFEYIDREYVKEYGDYVFYSCEDERVMDCMEYWNNKD